MRLIITASMLALFIASASAQTRVQSGVLQCLTKPTFGAIVGSVRKMDCTFKASNGAVERYEGVQGRIGIDVGVQAGAVLLWAVWAPTRGMQPGDLAGYYGGSSAEVAAGVGVGTQMLWGGSNKTVSLQPLSVEGQVGVNAALGLSSLRLTYVP